MTKENHLNEIIKNRDKKIQEQSDLIKKLEDYIAILEKNRGV
jgi:uncharacterized protein YjgD (DUF1641 family)